MSFTVKTDKCCSAVNRTAEFHTIRATIYDFVRVGRAEVVEVEMPKVGVWEMFGNFLIYKIFIAMQSFKVEMIYDNYTTLQNIEQYELYIIQ